MAGMRDRLIHVYFLASPNPSLPYMHTDCPVFLSASLPLCAFAPLRLNSDQANIASAHHSSLITRHSSLALICPLQPVKNPHPFLLMKTRRKGFFRTGLWHHKKRILSNIRPAASKLYVNEEPAVLFYYIRMNKKRPLCSTVVQVILRTGD